MLLILDSPARRSDWLRKAKKDLQQPSHITDVQYRTNDMSGANGLSQQNTSKLFWIPLISGNTVKGKIVSEQHEIFWMTDLQAQADFWASLQSAKSFSTNTSCQILPCRYASCDIFSFLGAMGTAASSILRLNQVHFADTHTHRIQCRSWKHA